MRRRAPRTAFTVGLAVGTIAALASAEAAVAQPGFHVSACDSRDPLGAGFTDFKTRGMVTKKACRPYGKGVRGLVLSVQHSGKRGARVKRGSVARFVISAPQGAAITSAAWSGNAVRSDCGYRMDVFAQGGEQTWPVYAARHCPRPGTAIASGDQRHTRAGIGAQRLVVRVICSQRACSRRGRNYLRTSSVALQVADMQDPAVAITSAPTGWVNGVQTVGYQASDNAGLASVAPSMRGASDDFPCQLTTLTPCPRQVSDQVTVDTGQLSEGSAGVGLVARDISGRSATSPPSVLHVDRTAPGRVDTALTGGDGWRPTSAFSLSWVNPNEPDRAPITAARYELCPAGGGPCTAQRIGGDGISTVGITPPAPGEWTARLWREDAAGNQSKDLASVPVVLRWDPTAPDLSFEPSNAVDPTSVGVRVSDQVSGVSSGTLELSQAGSGVWRHLSSTIEGGRLVGRIDDSQLPAGEYELRARAVDRAGNERSAAGPLLRLPLRLGTTIRAGQRVTKTRRVTVGHGRRRHVKRQRVTRYRTSVRIPLRGSRLVRGQLTREGVPLGAPIVVSEQDQAGVIRLVGGALADRRGRFSYRVRGSTSRSIIFSYLGGNVLRPSATRLAVTVPGATSIEASRRRLLNGQATVFRGRVRSQVPAAGKLVALQVRIGRGWRTFRTLRTDASGVWSSRYRFTSTCQRRKRWRIRAALPAEGGLPYASGRSSTVRVLVRGTGSC